MRGIYIIAVLALLAFFPAQTFAQGGCIPGVPCIAGKGEDNPNTSGPNAGKQGSESCDADFMNQLQSEAFMQAERESVTAQTLIRKPDSVLAYSCFDQLATLAARQGEIAGTDPLFFEDTQWAGVDVPINGGITIEDGLPYIPVPIAQLNVNMNSNRFDGTLENLILERLESGYFDTNFDHDFLGGGATGVNRDSTAGDSALGYNCSAMDSVHFLANCGNIGESIGFVDFNTLTQSDPRREPSDLACEGTAIKQDHIDIAGNKDFEYVNFDKVETNLDRLSGTGACGDPIPTGPTVKRDNKTIDVQGNVTDSGVEEYEEMTCSNTGCSYNPETQKCER